MSDLNFVELVPNSESLRDIVRKVQEQKYKLYVAEVFTPGIGPGKELVIYKGKRKKDHRAFYGTGGVPIEQDMYDFLKDEILKL